MILQINNQIGNPTYQFSSGNFVNVDEININFDMFRSRTLANHSERTIRLRTIARELKSLHLFFGVTMSGDNKVPLFIVFLGTRDGRIARQLQL